MLKTPDTSAVAASDAVFAKSARSLFGLCLTNIGYLNLSYYTWSEIPFMLFLLCFALLFARIPL